ncbi:MAG TPA: hypothetical protein VFY82_12250 [Acidimicrobiales bacterium]|nr:hypothetical protein [Acidimicrobiales bacterium]
MSSTAGARSAAWQTGREMASEATEVEIPPTFDELFRSRGEPMVRVAYLMVVLGVDRAGVDAVMAAVQVIGEEEWDALVRDHPPA